MRFKSRWRKSFRSADRSGALLRQCEAVKVHELPDALRGRNQHNLNNLNNSFCPAVGEYAARRLP